MMSTRTWLLGAAVAAASLGVIAGCSAGSDESASASTEGCEWPVGGHNLERTFAYPCATAISVDTVGDLGLEWFVNTSDVVSASPVVADGRLFVGDWAGRFYALDAASGEELWTFDAEPLPGVYAGQIVSPAALDEVGGTPVVAFGAGNGLHLLDAATGEVRWIYRFGSGNAEIQSSPVFFDGMVIIGTDTHNRPEKAGMYAIDAASGELRWHFDAEDGARFGQYAGCGDMWSWPTVDPERRLVFIGTANCPPSPEGWGQYTESLVAVDADTGEGRWSFQPHEPNNDDLDFAGAPNLFTVDGRDVVGLGNKDGTYYAVDRDSGELVWSAEATGPGLERPGSNFSTGGFIGPSAVADGVIAGTTAVGPPPYLHGIDAATGEFLWQSVAVQESYAPSAIANGVLFAGGNDFTLRGLNLRTGDILWSHQMNGVVAGGPIVVGDVLYAVSGIREPGSSNPSRNSGVYKFSLNAQGVSEATTTTVERVSGVSLVPSDQRCIGAPCEMFDVGITLRQPPDGLTPSAQLLITADPFSVRLVASDLGEPAQWLVPGTPAAESGATDFGLFISESDDNPVGGLLCVLDADFVCEADSLPGPSPSWNRITLLALEGPTTLPAIADGAARLLVTVSFEPPLTPQTGG